MAKILIHSLTFSPDGVSTAYLYNDIAKKIRDRGHQVVVLTTSPHYNIVPEQIKMQPLAWKIWGCYKKSQYEGITVFHVPQKKFKSTPLRILGFIYWHIISFFVALSIKGIDVILSPSPPLTLGVINILLSRIKKCKVIYNVQEIYPDILKLNPSGTTHRILKQLELFVYWHSDAVTTIDQVFYNILVNRFENPSKLHIIPNFVDTEIYHETRGENILDRNLFPKTDSLKLLYAGNIGFAQDWKPFIELAIKTKKQNIEYFVIGEGMKKKYVEDEVIAHNLHNVHILPYQPRNSMPAILSYADISFIFMSPDNDTDGFPSKVYTIMACEKPLLIISSEDSPIVKFLRPIGCAKLVTERNFNKQVSLMEQWLNSVNRKELQQMGKAGIEIIQKHYTKENVTGQYVNLIERILS